MSKVIINLCITGMVPTKDMTEFIPISSAEIIRTALACGRLGASIIHVHARDTDGKPTWKKDVFAPIIEGIRNKNNNLIINTTTSGRNWSDFERRADVLELSGDLKPDMASLTVGSMNFIKDPSMNSPEMIEQLATKMMERDIKPEFEVFEPGMVHKANYLLERGIVKDSHPYFNILLGSLGTSPLEPSVFAAFYAQLPKNAIWSVAGIGTYQLDANIMSLAYGGSVRVGLEDNIYYDRQKTLLASNEMLVERIATIIRQMGLEVATAEEARIMLGLKSRG
ncbi:MAG TPA: 3-keto-5-aminohexanoate cleavage protein [Gammaproteobacteria bacterium]|nr:3-keto-5-aminohexanoate cleavage protein [Gammaproteobacteria bacterium]